MRSNLMEQFDDPREVKAEKQDLLSRAKVFEDNAHLITRNDLLATQVTLQHKHIKELEAENQELRNQISVLTDSSFDDKLDEDIDTGDEDDE